MSKLVIAEKPSLARNIAKAVGAKKNGKVFVNDEYIITSVFGHLLELKDVKEYNPALEKWKDIPLPFIPERFEYKVKKSTQEQFMLIAKLIKSDDVKSIVHVGDADREGQLIVDNVLAAAGNKKPVERLWLPSQTDEDILEGLKKMEPNESYRLLHDEGLARTFMDWLLGINLTVYVTNKANELYSIGRVLTPIVKHVYDRDIEIENFKPEKFFELTHTIEKDGKVINLTFNERFSSLEEAEAFAAKLNGLGDIKLDEVVRKEVKKQRPNLYNLDKLQKRLNRDFGLSYDDSLTHIQGLYESQLLSYPRTSSEHLTLAEYDKLKRIVDRFGNEFVVDKNDKKVFDDSKVESHSAITITTAIPSALNGVKEDVYKTVENRMKAVFCSLDALVDSTSYNFSLADYTFKANGEALKQAGWSEYEPIKLKGDLPILEEGSSYKANFIPIEKETSPPKKITEAALFDYLVNPARFDKELNKIYNEAMGAKVELLKESDDEMDIQRLDQDFSIGTPATRSNIFENAIKYNYVVKSGKTLSVTDKGKELIEILDKLDARMYAPKSVEFEEMLIDVKLGNKTVDGVVKEVTEDLEDIIKRGENVKIERSNRTFSGGQAKGTVIGKCPKCGKNVNHIKNKDGKNLYFCEDRDCGFVLFGDFKRYNDVLDVTPAKAKKLLKGEAVNFKGLTKKDGSKFEANLVLKMNGKYANLEFASGSSKAAEVYGKCINCGADIIGLPMKKGGVFFKCTDECGVKFSTSMKYYSDEISLSKADVKKLLNGKTVTKIVTDANGDRVTKELALQFNDPYTNLVIAVE